MWGWKLSTVAGVSEGPKKSDLNRSSLVDNAEEFVVLQINFYWSIVALQFVPVLLYSKVSQSYIHMYPLLYFLPSLFMTQH